MHPALKRILSEKLRLFCTYCTLHGAYYLPRGRAACVTWGAIMAAGFALMGVLSQMIWHKYSNDPTVTVVESTYYKSDLIPFPAVMICDPQLVYGPKTENVSNILTKHGYDGKEIGEFYNSFLDIMNTSYVPPTYIKNMHTLLHDLGFPLATLFAMFKKPCSVTLVKCSWRSKQYNCSDMFREVATVVGHCCHFDMAHFKQNSPVNMTQRPGFIVAKGLELTVNGIKSFSNGTVTAGAVLMYVFDADTEVSKITHFISMSESNYYDIDIDLFVIESSAEVKALSLKKRKCSVNSDHGISANQNCISMLLMLKVVRYCRCLPFMYTAEDLNVENFPNCTWEQHVCIHSQYDKSSFNIQSVIGINDCYQRCDYVEYDPKAEFLKRKTGKNDTYTEVGIAYASSTCLKYRREVIYTWDQMLANLGGIFGLCLGGSIISVIEILWFLIDMLVTTFTFKENKSTTKIFVIEQPGVKKNDKGQNARYKFVNDLQIKSTPKLKLPTKLKMYN